MAQQHGRCFYCGRAMWEKDPEAFGWVFGVAPAAIPQLRCTAEHLKPRCEGGRNTVRNIVAACLYCNRTRHRAKAPLSPEAYRARVRDRIAAGKWLPLRGPGPVGTAPPVSGHAGAQ